MLDGLTLFFTCIMYIASKDDASRFCRFLAIANKSTSTAGAVQVEPNLLEKLSDHMHFRKVECCLNVGYLKSVVCASSHCFR